MRYTITLCLFDVREIVSIFPFRIMFSLSSLLVDPLGMNKFVDGMNVLRFVNRPQVEREKAQGK